MDCYEKLIVSANIDGIDVEEVTFETENLKGLCAKNFICINKNIETQIEKRCILAEEMGHFYTTVGNITDLSSTSNRKQENIARRWGFNKLLCIHDILNAFKKGYCNRYEMAEYLNITESFLQEATEYFKTQYGEVLELDDYIIKLSPLNIYPKNTLFHTC